MTGLGELPALGHLVPRLVEPLGRQPGFGPSEHARSSSGLLLDRAGELVVLGYAGELVLSDRLGHARLVLLIQVLG